MTNPPPVPMIGTVSPPLAWLADTFAEPYPELVERNRDTAAHAARLTGYPNVYEIHIESSGVTYWHGTRLPVGSGEGWRIYAASD